MSKNTMTGEVGDPKENGLYLVSTSERQDPRNVARWEGDHWRTVGGRIDGDNRVPDGNVILWCGPLVPRPPLEKLRAERISECHIRDYFAAAALTGILARESGFRRVNSLCDGRPGNQRHYEDAMAVFAYEMANAMLAARVPENHKEKSV